MAATAPEATGETRLNLRSEAAMAYLEFLGARQADFAAEARLLLGRDPPPPEPNGRPARQYRGPVAPLLSLPERPRSILRPRAR